MRIEYVQIELDAHDCVIAGGTWSETYADAPGMRAQFHNAAEYATLYPDAAAPDALIPLLRPAAAADPIADSGCEAGNSMPGLSRASRQASTLAENCDRQEIGLTS